MFPRSAGIIATSVLMSFLAIVVTAGLESRNGERHIGAGDVLLLIGLVSVDGFGLTACGSIDNSRS